MRRVRLVTLLALSLMLLASACSCPKSRKGGAGAGDDAMGEGNIPIAAPGEELKDAHFSFDSAALSAGAQATLRENAQWLNDNPDVKVVIEGHCDERGTAEYNMALGERRAKAVYDFVRSLGVARERMKTISYGEEMPLDPRSTEDAWAKNRRGHFSIQ